MNAKTKLSLCCLLGSALLPADGLAAGFPSFKAVDVDTKVEIGYGVAVADVDGDKKPDIILADKNQIVWYQNPSWTKHVIVEKLTQLDHVCIAAADIDGDGKAEIAAGAGWNPGDTVGSGSVHYLIPPADRTQRWQAVDLHHEPTVHRMRWVKNSLGKSILVVVPLHGRGNKGGEGEGVKIMGYEMPADPRGEWKTTVIDQTLHMTHNFNPVEWNKAKGEELLVAGKEGVFLFENVGAVEATPPGPNRPPNSGKWLKHQVGGNKPGETAFTGAGEVRNGRLGNGKRFLATVEPMHGNQLVVYLEPAPGSPGGLGERMVLDSNLLEGHALACGDFAKSGSDQIVVGWRGKKAGDRVGIKMFRPVDPQGKTWEQSFVDDNGMACEDLCLADLDGDGKLDIVASGRSTHNLKIYFNASPAQK